MNETEIPEVVVISSYPPRECGIATYSHDLISMLNHKFDHSFEMTICALETAGETNTYPAEVKYVLHTSDPQSYHEFVNTINNNRRIKLILIQHEFGFFYGNEENFLAMTESFDIPVIVAFHTVLPDPGIKLREYIKYLSAACDAIVVMTKNAESILMNAYGIPSDKIAVIPHGTHLVPHLDKYLLKEKYYLNGRTILSTFGLISSGKNIETTLDALPDIVNKYPDVLFLIIGKTHPTIVKHSGESYRSMLQTRVEMLNLKEHVWFINQYLPLPDLLEYLQLTDVYLFTSKDPNQAVSGTFSYAISCGCPIISTPIPHAKEVLGNDAGILVDFENAEQLTMAIDRLLENGELKNNIRLNGLHRIAPTAWENSAIAHAILFEKFTQPEVPLKYNLPEINLNHIKKLTTDVGIIQFSKINQPDFKSGYTIDDNARALIAFCQHYALSRDTRDLIYIHTYLHFIKLCVKGNGSFYNYIDIDRNVTEQNDHSNLDDANGRTIWALGFLLSHEHILPQELLTLAEELIESAFVYIRSVHSTRAIAFAIKGLWYYHQVRPSEDNLLLMELMANRLERMYEHIHDADWKWYENYLTYGNSILPEAMLCAFLVTGNVRFKTIAKTSFDFLLAHTFTDKTIKLISNKRWLSKGETPSDFGEQPIDVAYTVMALERFYDVFDDCSYLDKMHISFNWFLGNNHLHQIIYNPCTGGCYDGLEENHINLNQGAESTISYIMARLTMEKYRMGKPSVYSEPGLLQATE